MWPLFTTLQDPELCRLAEALSNTVLNSRATIATKKYMGAIKRWKSWASSHSLSFPCEAVTPGLQHLIEPTKSKAAAEEIVNGFMVLRDYD